MSLQDYLELCRRDFRAYASVAKCMLPAIGEPELLDTRSDPRLSRLYANKVIKICPAFREFYGMEETIENIDAYFRHAAQGLEEKKQILYLLEQDYGIPPRYLQAVMSPLAVKRLYEFNGDITRFRVVKLYPSMLRQIAVSKTEPGDENNHDISSLVGKIDSRKLESYSQNDPDAYSYSGGLCLANRGLLEFVEMFKAPIKVLHPLLTATRRWPAAPMRCCILWSPSGAFPSGWRRWMRQARSSGCGSACPSGPRNWAGAPCPAGTTARTAPERTAA